MAEGEASPSRPTDAKTRVPAESEVEIERPGEDWSVRYKYLLADFENFRRRTERDRETASRQLLASVLRELIPIYEAFDRARKASEGANSAVDRGMELIAHEWQRFFQREGVTPIAVIGARFAPEDEEAVAEVAADPDHPEGTVVEIVQQGYRFPGGLIRPAKIVVARSLSPAPERAEGSEATDVPREAPP